MNTPIRFRYLVALVGFATLLAGCSSGWSSPGVGSELAPSKLSLAGALAHFHPHRLWAAPDIARIRRLLFVSERDNRTVDIYSLPDLTLKGQVGGFTTYIEMMHGECTDRSGNIWVTGSGPYSSGVLTKLAHDGTILGSISTRYGSPYSCAVDPTTGNLAVNENSFYYPYGAVVIYAGGSGPGTVIKIPNQPWYAWDGYDTSGNLWVDGYSSKGGSIISRCGASSCRTIPISGGKIYNAGFVQYAVGEKTWYVADSRCDKAKAYCIYPVSVHGVLGTPITLTDRQGHHCSVVQGVITTAKSRALVGDAYCEKTISVARWNFPAGGPWTRDTSAVNVLVGAAISQK